MPPWAARELRKCCGWTTHDRPGGERGLCRGGVAQAPEGEKGPGCGGGALAAQAAPPPPERQCWGHPLPWAWCMPGPAAETLFSRSGQARGISVSPGGGVHNVLGPPPPPVCREACVSGGTCTFQPASQPALLWHILPAPGAGAVTGDTGTPSVFRLCSRWLGGGLCPGTHRHHVRPRARASLPGLPALPCLSRAKCLPLRALLMVKHVGVSWLMRFRATTKHF